MDDRFTISNMAIEAGGKNGIFPVDEKTMEYINGRVGRPCEAFEADPDAVYTREVVIDLDKLEPTVSMPHLPENTKVVSEVAGLHIDQVVIGSCTNGRIQDLREAAAILKGKKVAENVRCIVIPATQEITLQAMKEGLLEIFIASGCAVSAPHLRPLPGWTHGRHGGGGALRLHHQPQLCGPHGACAVGSHPGLSRRGRRLCSGRLRGRPPHLKRTAPQAQWGI